MDTTSQNPSENQVLPAPSAQEMKPLELNNIRLDVNHTILTPEYLENLKKQAVTN